MYFCSIDRIRQRFALVKRLKESVETLRGLTYCTNHPKVSEYTRPFGQAFLPQAVALMGLLPPHLAVLRLSASPMVLASSWAAFLVARMNQLLPEDDDLSVSSRRTSPGATSIGSGGLFLVGILSDGGLLGAKRKD